MCASGLCVCKLLDLQRVCGCLLRVNIQKTQRLVVKYDSKIERPVFTSQHFRGTINGPQMSQIAFSPLLLPYMGIDLTHHNPKAFSTLFPPPSDRALKSAEFAGEPPAAASERRAFLYLPASTATHTHTHTARM